MNPIIAYDNILTSYRETTGNEDILMTINGLSYDYWEADSVGIDELHFFGAFLTGNYIAIANHNLAGSQVTLEGDGFQIAQFTPTSNSPILVRFNEIQRSSWTVITNKQDGLARIGVLQIGQYTELERGIWSGHSPMTLNQSIDYSNNVSDAGQLLGRKIVRRGARGTIRVDNLTSDWVRNVWQPFARHAQKRGFFFQHNPDQFPDEVAYCWSTNDASANNDRVGGPNNRGLMSAEIPVRALI